MKSIIIKIDENNTETFIELATGQIPEKDKDKSKDDEIYCREITESETGRIEIRQVNGEKTVYQGYPYTLTLLRETTYRKTAK